MRPVRGGRRARLVLVVLLALVGAGGVPGRPLRAMEAAGDGQPDLPVAAKAAVLMDAATGEVFYAKNEHTPLPLASVTKIMTLILILEDLAAGRIHLEDLVTASERAASMGGSQVWLEPGEQMTVKELLYAVGVGSANDAAVALAEFVAGSEQAFVDRMNRRAAELGMRDSRFSNATGLPPAQFGLPADSHQASAYDIALMSRHGLRLPGFIDLVSTWEYVMRQDGKKEPVLYSYNRMLKRYPGMNGIKTGFTTEAGFCIAASAKREGLQLIAVTLGNETSARREADVRAMLDYGFRTYRAHMVARAGDRLATLPVLKGREEQVPVTVQEDLAITVKRAESPRIERAVVPAASPPVAPVPRGTRAGELVALRDGREVARVPLVTQLPVERASVMELVARSARRLVAALLP